MALRGLRSAFNRGGTPDSKNQPANALSDPSAVQWGPPAGTLGKLPATQVARGGDANEPAPAMRAASPATPTLRATAGPGAGPTGPAAPAPGGWVPASRFLRTPVQTGPGGDPAAAGAAPSPATPSSIAGSAAFAPPAGRSPAGPATGPAGAAARPGAPARLALGSPVPAAVETRPGGMTTFGCPSCGSTIAKGSRRCQSCGRRMLFDVPVRKATALVGSGLVIGLVAGGLVVGLALPRDAASAGTGAGGDTAAATLIPVSGNAAAALRGTVTLNGRLAAEAEPLSAALTETTFNTQDVVKILRRMSSDMRAASAMVPSLGAWPEAADHETALSNFYGTLTDQINGALSASVTSEGSYRAATTQILATLRQIPALDAGARRLADGTTVQLPAVEIPAALQ